MSNEPLNIVLAGNPNCGKTSLFNVLTGLNQKVSNLPGTTIEQKCGFFQISFDTVAKITDLPGSYSIYPKSEDEIVTAKFLIDPTHGNKTHVIVFVVDASNLSRNLLFFTQVADLGIPIILALNLLDLAEKKQIAIDIESLSRELSVIVCPINARTGKGVEELKKKILKVTQPHQQLFFEPNVKQRDIINSLKESFPGNSDYRLWLLAFQRKDYKVVLKINDERAFDTLQESSRQIQADETVQRYRKINTIVAGSVTKSAIKKRRLSSRLDELLVHPLWGFLIFFGTLFIIFQSVFRIAEWPMQWIETVFVYVGGLVDSVMPKAWYTDLIVNGVIAGLSGVLAFLPQIMILFTLLAILEDTGYMTRVSFMTDRLMRKFGLNGKSIIPLVGSMACAIPSIMATRNIENKKDRLITILVTPLMSCSARLPVYTLLASLMIPEHTSWYGLDLRGLLLLAMYVMGFLAAIIFAFIFKKILNQKERSFFILELPDYRLPRWKNIALSMRSRVNDFVLNAGKVIILVSILLWFLANFGPGDTFKQIELRHAGSANNTELIKAEKLEASYAGILGKAIEPAIKPLGFDWKIGIALITSFAAREVFVGTMATIYSVGDVDDSLSIREKMAAQINPNTGKPLYGGAVAFSLMIFYAFAMQCFSTLAVTYRETKSIKWPIVQFFYMTGFAYLASFVVFQLLK
ncbi:MAG: ferrous iron transport protein B [Bacteroidia bacterium]|nr:ferrous iron transport protein B [Bacteroidia bacterium]